MAIFYQVRQNHFPVCIVRFFLCLPATRKKKKRVCCEIVPKIRNSKTCRMQTFHWREKNSLFRWRRWRVVGMGGWEKIAQRNKLRSATQKTTQLFGWLQNWIKNERVMHFRCWCCFLNWDIDLSLVEAVEFRQQQTNALKGGSTFKPQSPWTYQCPLRTSS